MPTLKTKPVFTDLSPSGSSSADADGILIVRSLVIDHGFQEHRFVNLSRTQQDYIESTLCVIIGELCSHLENLGQLK